VNFVLEELKRVATTVGPQVDMAAAFAKYGTVDGQMWQGWVTVDQFELALTSLGMRGVTSDHITSVSERFGRTNTKLGRRMVASTALLRAIGLDTEINRAAYGIGEPTEPAVREILMGFYRANHPEFASDAKIVRILDSFRKKETTTGTPWYDLLWDAYSQQNVEPRKDIIATGIQRCARGWIARGFHGGKTSNNLAVGACNKTTNQICPLSYNCCTIHKVYGTANVRQNATTILCHIHRPSLHSSVAVVSVA